MNAYILTHWTIKNNKRMPSIEGECRIVTNGIPTPKSFVLVKVARKNSELTAIAKLDNHFVFSNLKWQMTQQAYDKLKSLLHPHLAVIGGDEINGRTLGQVLKVVIKMINEMTILVPETYSGTITTRDLVTSGVISDSQADAMMVAGLTNEHEIFLAGKSSLVALNGIGEKTADKILKAIGAGDE